jgi:hypothetical protein
MVRRISNELKTNMAVCREIEDFVVISDGESLIVFNLGKAANGTTISPRNTKMKKRP